MLSRIVDLFTLNKKSKVREKPLAFEKSSQYWDDRYLKGLNSGAGSYGRLAIFKAEILNEFVKTHDIRSVVEYGCGDGAQLSLATYKSYTGFDVSPTAIEMCKKRFRDCADFVFLETREKSPQEGDFELAISLDVIYHLVEDEVFISYMKRLFLASKNFVVIYSSNNETDLDAPHEKRRIFQEWIDENAVDWKLIDTIYNKFPYDKNNPEDTSLSDFFIYKKQVAVE